MTDKQGDATIGEKNRIFRMEESSVFFGVFSCVFFGIFYGGGEEGRGDCERLLRSGCFLKSMLFYGMHRVSRVLCVQRMMLNDACVARGGVWGDKIPPQRLRSAGALCAHICA